MSNEAMLACDLFLRSFAAVVILFWMPVLFCWVVCFIAWVKGYPETMTIAEVVARIADGVLGKENDDGR